MKKRILARNSAHYLDHLKKNRLNPHEHSFVGNSLAIRGCRFDGDSIEFLESWYENPAYDKGFMEVLRTCVPPELIP